MKMRKWICLLLAVVLAAGLVYPGALALVDANAEPDFYITQNGQKVTSVSVPQNGSVALESSASGQWQIQVGDTWANIQGEVYSSLNVTYAMIASLGGSANLRFTTGELMSNIVTATLGEAPASEEPTDSEPTIIVESPYVEIGGNEPTAAEPPVTEAPTETPTAPAVDLGAISAEIDAAADALAVAEEELTAARQAEANAQTAYDAAAAAAASAKAALDDAMAQNAAVPAEVVTNEDGTTTEIPGAPVVDVAPLQAAYDSAAAALAAAQADLNAAAALAAEKQTACDAAEAKIADLESKLNAALNSVTYNAVESNGVVGAETEEKATTPAPDKVIIQIEYVMEKDGRQVSEPYVAEVAKGSNFNRTVNSPVITGYTADRPSVVLDYPNIQEPVTITVKYFPAEVAYMVEHYLQKVDGSGYTLTHTDNKTGLTESVVEPNLKKEYTGFVDLWYDDTVTIAADSSTVVKIYYDRQYYLMKFELSGGYGVEPIYARYDAPISVADPERTGYTFTGWDQAIPPTMPAQNMTITALWTAGGVTYTVVFWKENADDAGYSYWTSQTKTITAGAAIPVQHDLPNTVTDGAYFTLNSALTAALNPAEMTAAGDGSTVYNVYYSRNYYTINFYGYGTCALEAHTHTGTDGECYGLACGLEIHNHTASGCTVSITCGRDEHTHSADCCTSTVGHTHSTTCYEGVGNQGYVLLVTNPQQGQVYYSQIANATYIYIGKNWYNYTGSTPSGQIAQPSCGKTVGVHSHEDGNCTCSISLHTHSEACYTYSCGLPEHKEHTSSCYGLICTKQAHSHNNNCNKYDSSNVIYTLTAKYEQTIGDIWPTVDVLKESGHAYVNNSGNVVNTNGNVFRGWSGLAATNQETISKRVTMTADLCNTSNGVKNATALYGSSYTFHLYYMFESFDQESPANGKERRYYNGKYYDKSTIYSQDATVNTTTPFAQKDISGMTKDGVESNSLDNNEYDNFLYYGRTRHTLTYQNAGSNPMTKNVNNIMFEQPLVDYTDSTGALLRSYVPPYPNGWEEGVYSFEGWYTTPECFDGTQVNWETLTMPNNNLTIYAKWVPVNRNVTFYMFETMKPEDICVQTFEVPHGFLVTDVKTVDDPVNGGMYFVGWFYKNDEGEEVAFDLNNSPVNRDLNLYAKWSATEPMSYTIRYAIENIDGSYTYIAPETTGKALVDTTKTFNAKTGAELNPDYQEGYYPVVGSHNVYMDPQQTSVEYTFVYITMPELGYKVMYLDKDTNTELSKEVIKTTKNAVVTENYLYIEGYTPTEVSQQLVLSAEGPDGPFVNNVIIFYYVVDKENVSAQVNHWTLNPETNQYELYSTAGYPKVPIGDTFTEEILTLTGYDFIRAEAVDTTDEAAKAAEVTVGKTSVSLTVPSKGFVLNLYYDCQKLSYTFHFMNKDTNEPVMDDVIFEDQNYGKHVQYPADSEIDGIYVIDGSNIADFYLTKDTEYTFYYVEKDETINYEVVGPENCGTLDRYTEIIKIASGTASGSAPTANETFKFVGWFTNPDCTSSVNSAWVDADGKLVPQKVNGKYASATYYAKFEYNLTELTISKDGTVYDSTDTFIFDVRDSNNAIVATVALQSGGRVVVTGLTVGETYKVTERAHNNRYGTPFKFITLNPTGNSVTITNTASTYQWLGASSLAHNVFGN